MNEHFQIELRIDSQPRLLCAARRVMGTVLERLGFDDVTASQVTLAVDEAVANVVRHGYDGKEDQPIWMKIALPDDTSNGRLCIVIEDRAKQVDPEQICGRDLEDIRPGGLGVHIIRKIMDEVDYTRRTGGGMRLTMCKQLTPQPDPASPKTPSSS